jgi:hypothetical protein
MRKILIHLLMFLMLMPGLACGPFMHAGTAHGQTMAMKDCHEMGMEKAQKIPDSGRLFFKYCMKADLHSAHHAGVKAPDLDGKILFDVPAVTINTSFVPLDAQSIRGPPPDWPVFSQIHPSILTTQRLRI